MRDLVVGEVDGTGSAINVSLGFIPSMVIAINVEDAGGLEPTAIWINGMAAANMALLLGTPTYNLVTSNGITAYAGSSSASPGFTIGADANLNASGEKILYAAFR